MKKAICIILCVLLITVFGSCREESVKQDSTVTVYVSEYGKIHSYPTCSGMTHYTAMPLSTAISEGYVPCKKCATHF